MTSCRATLVAASGAILAAATMGGAQATQPAGATAFIGATVFDGTERSPIVGATILVRDGRVVAVGRPADVTVPAGAARVDLRGKFIMPGLVNAHGHVTAPATLGTYAAYGVTSVYSLGDEPASVFAVRDSQRAGARRADGAVAGGGARVWVSGPVLNPRTADEARAQVAGLAARRVDIVKIRVDDNLGTAAKMSPDVYRAVITESHRLGLRTAVHLFYLADAKAVLDAGADLVAHSVRDAAVDAEVIAALKAKDVCVVPTLMREVSTFVYENTPSWFADPLFQAHANPEWVANGRDPARQQAVRQSASAQRYKEALRVASRNVKALSDAGATVAMGTDTGPAGRFQGYFELMELELMVEAGLTPRQALTSATRDAARCIHADREVGTLEPGKWADFVVLDADPLASISNVRRIAEVRVAGRQVAR